MKKLTRSSNEVTYSGIEVFMCSSPFVCGLFDVVIVDVWVDPRHENALALDVRTVHCAGDLTAIGDPVDAEPSDH
jgi:hypothetical protein